MFTLYGNYSLRLKVNDIDMPIDSDVLLSLTITQNIDVFLPTFEMKIKDSKGIFSHYLPLDRESEKVYIQIAFSYDSEKIEEHTFRIIRSEAIQVNQLSTVYEMNGMLDLPNAISPSYRRGWNKSFIEVLEEIGKEMDIDVECSGTLDQEGVYVQANETNISFLQMVSPMLVDRNGNGGYFTYIAMRNGRYKLFCNRIYDLIKEKTKKKYISSQYPFEDYLPIYDYEFLNNYGVMANLMSAKESYEYFDYISGEYKEEEVTTDDYVSLTDVYLINENDDTFIGYRNLGRKTEQFIPKSIVYDSYGERLLNLNNLWITIQGDFDVTIGDTVKVLFAGGGIGSDIFNTIHSGYYFVAKTIHIIGKTHLTKLLLIRNGIDVNMPTTLKQAKIKKTE